VVSRGQWYNRFALLLLFFEGHRSVAAFDSHAHRRWDLLVLPEGRAWRLSTPFSERRAGPFSSQQSLFECKLGHSSKIPCTAFNFQPHVYNIISNDISTNRSLCSELRTHRSLLVPPMIVTSTGIRKFSGHRLSRFQIPADPAHTWLFFGLSSWHRIDTIRTHFQALIETIYFCARNVYSSYKTPPSLPLWQVLGISFYWPKSHHQRDQSSILLLRNQCWKRAVFRG